MKTQIGLSVVTVILVILSTFTYFNFHGFANDEDRLNNNIFNAKANANIMQPNNQNNVIQVPNNNVNLTEIVMSSEDIYLADIGSSIGTNSPFNTDFITKQDVLNSIEIVIKKLELDFKSLDTPIQNQLITLRHVEMIEKTPESKSAVYNVAKTYKERLLKEVPTDGESDGDELIYRADVSIAETEKTLEETENE